MERIPLIDAPMHKPPVRPPSNATRGAVCPRVPADVVEAQGKGPLNGSLYPHGPEVFKYEGQVTAPADLIRVT